MSRAAFSPSFHVRRLWRFASLAVLFLVAAGAFATNPVQHENAKSGTVEWQLFSPGASHDIQGYASLTSVNRGDAISFFVSTNSPTYTIDIYRVGWYGGTGGRHVFGPISRAGVLQPMPASGPDGLRECDWSDPFTLTIPGTPDDPTDWASGVYLAKLTAAASGRQSYIIFTVRDDNRIPAAAFLYQASVNTWQAYNNWGGQSLYSFNSDGGIPAQKVSFNRPYGNGGAGDFFEWEINMVRFLEREGYDVSYATNVDLHEQGLALVAPHQAFLSVGHDEYWSYQMKSAIQQARDQGQHLGFFGSDAIYWQARYQPSTLASAQPNRNLVAYKEAAADRDPYWLDADASNDKYVTTRFRDIVAPPFNVQDAVAQPENGVVGVMYHGDEVQGDIVVSDSASWVYEGTGVTNGRRFIGLLGYETDAVSSNGFGPAGLQIVAESPDIWGVSNMATYIATSGAVVFATGSMQWIWALDDYNVPYGRPSRLDPLAQQATRNILTRFTMSAPGAPGDPVAGVGNGQANVTFAAPSSSGGAATLRYTVTSTPPGGIDHDAGSSALSHLVSGLANGTEYTFTVTASNWAGAGAQSNPSISVTPAAAAGAPLMLGAVAGDAQASVSFAAPAVEGDNIVTGYTVTSYPAGGVDSNAGSTDLSHTIIGLTNGTAYIFTVSATTAAASEATSTASNNVTPLGAPAAPIIGTAVAGDARAIVTFAAPASNGGAPITGYTVLSNPAGGVDPGAGSTSYRRVITGLVNGTPYTFTVVAANAIGAGAASNPSNSATPVGAPSAPVIGSALAGVGQATIMFAAPASDGGSPIAGYTVVSDPAGGTDNQGGSTALSHVVTGLTNGTAYTFTVRATNAAGLAAASTASSSVTPLGTPGAPVIGTATAGNTQATVTFSAPADLGGSVITGYSVVSNPAGGVDSNAGGTGMIHLVTGLTNGAAYTFSVKATNAAGTGAASAPSISVTPAGPPGAPAGVIASGGNTQASVNFGAASSNGSVIAGYTVMSNPAGGIDQNAGSTALTHVVTGLANGTAYTFTVAASNVTGTGAASAPSNSVTPAAAPTASTMAASSVSATDAILNGVVNANGASTSVTFDYGTSSAYGMRTAATQATVAPNAGSTVALAMSGLNCNTTYHFRVNGVNLAGMSNGSDRSFTTSACSGTVPGAPSINTATPGAGRATLSFSAPAGNGGNVINGYTATCAAAGKGARYGSGAGSPITVSGLSAGVVYACSVIAANGVGNSMASSTLYVTPLKGNDLTPILMLLLD